jgi:hypothetical protein
MKIMPYVVLTVVQFIAATAFGDYCVLSNTCDGDDICTDFVECDTPRYVPLDECDGDADCSALHTCTNGVCKPTGVYCESNTGVGVVTAFESLFECRNGSVAGTVHGDNWEWICEPGGEDEVNCDAVDVQEMPELTLDRLFESCHVELDSRCGEKSLDPEEECSEDGLALCTDLILFDKQFDAECNEKEEDDSVDVGEITAPPALVIHCCNHNFIDNREQMASYLSCVSELSPSDCEAVEECIDDVYDDVYGEDRVASSGAGVGDSDDNGDDESKADSGDNGTSSNSGCAVTGPGRASHSLLYLLL